jgi:hypothetical protein
VVTPGEAAGWPTPPGRCWRTCCAVWDIRCRRDGGLDGLPKEGVEMFLDVATKGRGLRGFVDTGERLRGDEAAYIAWRPGGCQQRPGALALGRPAAAWL